MFPKNRSIKKWLYTIDYILVLFFLFFTIKIFAQQDSKNQRSRLNIDGFGSIVIKSVPTTDQGQISQLIHEKPGGSKIVLAESLTFDFVSLDRADLDGDQIPEIVVTAKNRGTDDFLPYIFQIKNGFKRIFPLKEEDNPLIGKSISLVPAQTGILLCIKIVASYYDFGPPDLFIGQLYQLKNGKLEKIREYVEEGTHFNQKLNYAGYLFSKNDFLGAAKIFQDFLSKPPPNVPTEALAAGLLGLAESRMSLKDFARAKNDFKAVLDMYAQSDAAEQAQRRYVFLTQPEISSHALSLFVDVEKLEKSGRAIEALHLLENGFKSISTKGIESSLLFKKAEILISLGKIDEALSILKKILKEFPNTIHKDEIETTIQELEASPEEAE